MAYVEDKWVRRGNATALHGTGLRYRVRWSEGLHGKEVSRSFSDLGEAEALARDLNQRNCTRAAGVIEGLCDVHGNQLLMIRARTMRIGAQWENSCVMPAPGYIPMPAGAITLCGSDAPHEVAGAWFCRKHYAAVIGWHEERMKEAADHDPDWAMGWEATARHVVYYLLRETDGLIKIGTSSQFPKRLVSLRREHGPLRILLTHAGDRVREQNIHLQFGVWWAAGEWFRPGAPLLEWIEAARRRKDNIRTVLDGTEPLKYILGIQAVPELEEELAADPAA